MTPPADPREVLRALVAAGEKATPGEWHETHGEIECDQCGEQAYLCDVTSHAEDDTPYLSLAMQFVGLESLARPNANFVCAAANARPALSAIAGKVWLEPEVVRKLVDCARCVIDEGEIALKDETITEEEAGMVRTEMDRVDAALARAEAELRAVEEVSRG